MPGDGRDLHRVEAFLEQAAGGLVAEVMESEVRDPRAAASCGKKMGYVSAREHLAVDVARQPFQKALFPFDVARDRKLSNLHSRNHVGWF